MKKFMESDHNVLRDKAVFIAIENHEEDLIDFLRESEVKILADFYDAVMELGLSGESLFKAGMHSNTCSQFDKFFKVDKSVNEIESANSIIDLVDRHDLEQELREEFHRNPTNKIFECTEESVAVSLDTTCVHIKIVHTEDSLFTREICRAFAVLAFCGENMSFNELAKYFCIDICAEWES